MKRETLEREGVSRFVFRPETGRLAKGVCAR